MNKLFAFITVSLLVAIPGCGQQPVKKTGLVVINVLEKELYDDCHIKGSIHVPIEEIDICQDTIDKDAQLVVYCSNYQCTTSEYVAKKLKEQGFCNVCVYEGGMAEWYQEGLPVEGPCQKKYLTKPLRKVINDAAEIENIEVCDLALKMGIDHASNVAA